jgi:hypothetical protein
VFAQRLPASEEVARQQSASAVAERCGLVLRLIETSGSFHDGVALSVEFPMIDPSGRILEERVVIRACRCGDCRGSVTVEMYDVVYAWNGGACPSAFTPLEDD